MAAPKHTDEWPNKTTLYLLDLNVNFIVNLIIDSLPDSKLQLQFCYRVGEGLTGFIIISRWKLTFNPKAPFREKKIPDSVRQLVPTCSLVSKL